MLQSESNLECEYIAHLLLEKLNSKVMVCVNHLRAWKYFVHRAVSLTKIVVDSQVNGILHNFTAFKYVLTLCNI